MRRKALAGLMAGLWLMPCWSAAAKAAKKDAPKAATFSKQIPPDQRIQQALNRLTFGPRPGDAERVRSLGLKKWIDLQLHPARIPANPVLEAKLKPLDTLSMTGAELVTNYPSPQVARLMVSGHLPFPTDPDRRMTIQKIVARLNRAQGQATQTRPAPADLFTPEQLRALRTGTPQQRLAFFGALPPEKQEQVIEALDRKSTRLNSSHAEIYTLSLHDALPIFHAGTASRAPHRDAATASGVLRRPAAGKARASNRGARSEEHTSELQPRRDLHSFPTRRSSDLSRRNSFARSAPGRRNSVWRSSAPCRRKSKSK